jgi:transketolase
MCCWAGWPIVETNWKTDSSVPTLWCASGPGTRRLDRLGLHTIRNLTHASHLTLSPPDLDARALAARLRAHALRMVAAANASHIGSCLSCADILAVLYGRVLRVDAGNPRDPARDKLFMSKGHAAAILYAALAERGFLPTSELIQYNQDGSRLTGHVTHAVPGVELSTGSLGHALPVAVGSALAAQRLGLAGRVFCILSDGECDEGSNWEAFLLSGHLRLGITIIIDYNKIQSFGRTADVLDLEPFADKLRACRWRVHEVDGHDVGALEAVLAAPPDPACPSTAVLAHTVKGKGVSWMEDRLEWHYKSPSPAQLIDALSEVARP